MKIRTGVVSNSSSSSFCILGREVPTSSLEGDIPESTLLDTYRGITELYGEFVGVRPDDMPEDKTIKEIKSDIAKEISRVYGVEYDESKILWYTDGGYDS